MSVQFWINFAVAVVVLILALLFVNRSKFLFIQRLRATWLRKKIIPKMKAILPLISDVLQADQVNIFPLFKLRADLEALVLKSDALFEVERNALIEFLQKLSLQISDIETSSISNNNIEELILSGERTIVELSELA